MSDVLLDGVSIQLPDPPPASFSEVRAVLEETLAARGRVLAGLWIDGQPFDETIGTLAPTGRIEAASLALAEALAQVGAALAPEVAALRQEVDAFANTVVRVPWSEAQGPCLQLMQTVAQLLQRAVDVASLAGEGSAAAVAITALAAAMEQWMAGLQHHDAASICLTLDGAVGPALGRLAAALQEQAPA